MNQYIEHLNLNEHLKDNVLRIMETHEYQIGPLVKKFQKGNMSCLKGQPDLIILAVMLTCLEDTKEFYKERGIGEKIFYDTMADIGIWCGNNGNRGLKNYEWIENHVHGRLFRLGRLQFQMYRCCNETLDFTRLPFPRCEPVIYIHIPQGEKLELLECQKSIEQARAFFATYFPEYEYRYFFCESWLLFAGNRCFMSEDSNIVKFASLFHMEYSVEEEAQAIERIFGESREQIKDYPEETSLQKKAKAYMLAGNRLGVGVGTILH